MSTETVPYITDVYARSADVLGTAGVANFSGALTGSAHGSFVLGTLRDVTITWNLRRR